MSKIILFANRKGGTGKTTCAVLLATSLAQQNYKVLVVDTDDQQSIASLYDENANSTFELVAFPQDITRIEEKNVWMSFVKRWRQNYDFIILDAAGRLEVSYKFDALNESADLVMVPVNPTDIAWNGTKDYIEYMLKKKQQGHAIRLVTFINMYWPRRKRSRQMARELASLKVYGIEVMTNPVYYFEELGELRFENLLFSNETACLNVFNWSREVQRIL